MTSVEKAFQQIGTKLVIQDGQWRPRQVGASGWRLNIRTNGKQEHFVLTRWSPLQITVPEVQPANRHLLLSISDGKSPAKFLCGHDERHYFAAGVSTGVHSIQKAMESLQPAPIRELAARLRPKDRFTRKNEAYLRQGEWFFVPMGEDFKVPPLLILTNEPIRRGRSKPHMCQHIYRTGGRDVMFHRSLAPTGMDPNKFVALDDEVRVKHGWTRMRVDAEVYAMGKITHSDHATLTLHGWHRVYLSEEVSYSSEVFGFLD